MGYDGILSPPPPPPARDHCRSCRPDCAETCCRPVPGEVYPVPRSASGNVLGAGLLGYVFGSLFE
jgi:hypothetical protein